MRQGAAIRLTLAVAVAVAVTCGVATAAPVAPVAPMGPVAPAAPVSAPASVPTPEQVRAAYRSSEASLLDRHGVPVQSLRIDMTVRRLPWVALDDMSPALPAALLQAEDQRFYQHDGVDWNAAAKCRS